MQIKKYRGPTLGEALKQVRADLGADALILDTKRLAGAGVSGWLGKRGVEVTAARDGQGSSGQTGARDQMRVANRRSFAERAYEQQHEDAVSAPADNNSMLSLREELQNVRANLRRLAQTAKPEARVFANPILRLFYQRLRDSGVEEDIAVGTVHAMGLHIPPNDTGEPRTLRQALAVALENVVKFSGPVRIRPGKCTIIALVGPTGAGKTTTIAKLAANLQIHQRAGVGLLSVDTYRLAAIDQLRSFAHIADMPLHVAYSCEETTAALQRLAHLDVVFVDTAGRSPRHREHLEQLHEFIRAAGPDHVHLVVSATTKPADLALITQQFSSTRFDHVIVTKTDETTETGTMLNLRKLARVPFSYFTTGQNIPEDIVTADAVMLSDWILSGAGF